MGMDSERLSRRERQPGHDRTFRTSETNFVDAARKCLDAERYLVDDRPRDLIECFGKELGERALGLQPEASIKSLVTGRMFFVEVKKQGPEAMRKNGPLSTILYSFTSSYASYTSTSTILT
jgi:hypothetical protein